MKIADCCRPVRLIPKALMCLAAAMFLACAPALASNAAAQTSTSDDAGASATNSAEKAAGHAMQNPYEGDPKAIARGDELYMTYGCYACHGAKGGGHMGPSLIDADWLYGSSDADVFETLIKGRPGGMPAWDDVFTDKQIWKVIAYLRSLEKEDPK